MKSIIIVFLIGFVFTPISYVDALPKDAELVLQNITIVPLYPEKGDPFEIIADVYNAGLKNTSSLASIITAAFFVDGKLVDISEIENIEPGIENKIKIMSSSILDYSPGEHKIKVVLDYHNSLNDQYDSPVDNILEKTFFVDSLKSTSLSLDVLNAYVLQDEQMPVITVFLTDYNTGVPLANKKITLDLASTDLNFITGSDGKISVSYSITSLGSAKIVAYFEGDDKYSSSKDVETVYILDKETPPSLIITIKDSEHLYDFENYLFDIVIFQDSYDTVIEKIQPNFTTLLDSKTVILPLPSDHEYFAEVYLDGRLFAITDKDLLENRSILVKELKVPERSTIKFKILEGENQPITGALVTNWIYSGVSDEDGFTDWMNVLPTNYGIPYIAEVLLPDQKTVSSDPFLLFSGEQKIISIIVNEVSSTYEIPPWIKNNAGWWATGQIDDDSFIRGMQFLIKEGILKTS